ncbi:MAG: hypothetical protein R6X14_07715 [bacterium]
MLRNVLLALVLLAAVSVTAAQSWEIEPVDSAGWGPGLQMRRHPDGRLFLCYADTTGSRVRLTWQGDTWLREDVPLPAPISESEPRFAFSPGGTVAVTTANPAGAWLSCRTDTTWTHTPLPDSFGLDWRTMPVAFDSADRPVLAVNFDPYGSGGWVKALGLLRLDNTVWALTDTLDLGPRAPRFDVTGFDNRSGTGLWGTYRTSVYDVGYSYMDIKWFRWQGEWRFGTWFGGERASVHSSRGAVDRDGTVHATYFGSDTTGRHGFFYDYSVIGGDEPGHNALAFDSLGRPLAAFTAGAALTFGYCDSRGWHFFDVGVTGIEALDVQPGPDGQPLIAYAASGGVFLARGIGITGVESPIPTHCARLPGPTIVRGVLSLGAGHNPILPGESGLCPKPALLDISGRKVMELAPGDNDVSRLSPGVYFIRAGGARGKGAGGSSAKVVVQR